MTVLNLQCGEVADDADQKSSGTVDPTYSSHAIGNSGGWGFGAGFRFPSVSGLSGSSIDSAVFTFRSQHTRSGSFIGDWYAHDATAPGVFTTTAFNITDEGQRPRTTATCEADGTDFGAWISGQDYTFDGVTPLSGTNTIADIIQELADSYDPSAIAMLFIFSSGNGSRTVSSYDNNPTTAPKLDITYTAGGGSTQTATPSPVTIPVTIPDPKLGLTPDPVVIPILIPDPRLALTPDPVVIPILIPDPTMLLVGRIDPDPVTIPITVPNPTISAGAVTLTPDAVPIPVAIPILTLIGAAIIHPDSVVIPIAIPDPTLSAGAVTLAPDPVTIPVAIPDPVVSGPGAAEAFTSWGLIERFIDPDEFAPGTTFFLEIGMFTSSALVEVRARVFNVTDGVVVSGSEVTTTETSYVVVRSSSFSLTSGLRKYRIEFGGEQGGIYSCHGGDVKPEGS